MSAFAQGLYDEHESSMDELGGFEPTDTTGFIQIESIRIKKSVTSLMVFSLIIDCITDGRKLTSARVVFEQNLVNAAMLS